MVLVFDVLDDVGERYIGMDHGKGSERLSGEQQYTD